MSTRELDFEVAMAAIRAGLHETARIEGELLPSGVISITIWWEDHFAVLDGRPPHSWEYSYDFPDSDGFMGHDHIATSLRDAIEVLQRAWHGS